MHSESEVLHFSHLVLYDPQDMIWPDYSGLKKATLDIYMISALKETSRFLAVLLEVNYHPEEEPGYTLFF